MRVLLVIGCLTATLALCPPASAAEPVAPNGAAPVARAAAFSPPQWMRNLAKQYLKRYAKKVAKQVFKEWLESKASDCSDYLPRAHYCPPELPRWGQGITLRAGNGAPPGAFAGPSRNSRQNGALRVNVTYWLRCWTYGQPIYLYGGGTTSVWYWVPYQGYASAALLYTGTPPTTAIPGVARC